jgi:hypothetical protein
MKTPREILLARHRAAEPKLNQARTGVLARLPRRRESSVPASIIEWLRMPRVAWGALGAAWVVIIALNLAARETVSGPAAPVRTVLGAENRQALREQKRLLAELVGSRPEAKAARSGFVPRPRSEIKMPVALA